MIKLILGNISFDESVTTIHEIYGILDCENKETAYEIGDDLCNIFLAYLIPTE